MTRSAKPTFREPPPRLPAPPDEAAELLSLSGLFAPGADLTRWLDRVEGVR